MNIGWAGEIWFWRCGGWALIWVVFAFGLGRMGRRIVSFSRHGTELYATHGQRSAPKVAFVPRDSEGRCDFLAILKPGVAKPAQLIEFKYFTNAAAVEGKILDREKKRR